MRILLFLLLLLSFGYSEELLRNRCMELYQKYTVTVDYKTCYFFENNILVKNCIG